MPSLIQSIRSIKPLRYIRSLRTETIDKHPKPHVMTHIQSTLNSDQVVSQTTRHEMIFAKLAAQGFIRTEYYECANRIISELVI